MKITRTLRYGGYATLVIAAVIAIVAGINITLDQFPWRVDMTLEGFYTLSDQTQKVLASVRSPVTVLELWEAGKEDEKVLELLRKYQARSGALRVRQVDPYRSPVELKPYMAGSVAPDAGSLIVVSTGGRFKILKQADLYVMEQDQTTGEQVPTTFIAESAVTNAIASVTAASDPVLYFLNGHGEKPLQSTLSDRVAKAFYVAKPLTLAAEPTVPDDATMVIDISPQQDWTPHEAAAVLSFLRNRGGKLLLLTDLGASAEPVLGQFLQSYGLAIHPWLVVETASSQYLPNQPYVLIPTVGTHAITSTSGSGSIPILFPLAQVIEQQTIVRRTVTIDPLLLSSAKSYAKVNLDDASGAKGPKDPSGPFVLAAAVTDSGEVGQQAHRLVVMGSSHFIFPTADLGRLEENENLFMNTLGWLQDRPELISIPPRTISGTRYDINLSQFQFILFGGVAAVVIPLAIFAAALVTWLRRRHK
jgi:ABC-2 type transport system permease protein